MPARTLKSEIFKFKQFDIDQNGCAMKINTDGVLLGALAGSDNPAKILDIGTGTGVIALMLAQRFPNAQIDAVEIDLLAAATADKNFSNSRFAEKLNAYPGGFEQFFESNPLKKYDLIVSNPPFYINSLKSPQREKQVAKHADHYFFERLINIISNQLTSGGKLCMILPIDTSEVVTSIAVEKRIYLDRTIDICSFPESLPHRAIVYYGFSQDIAEKRRFVIYRSVGNYSDEYTNLLKPYFIAF